MQVRPQARGKLAAVVEECSEIHELDKCMEYEVEKIAIYTKIYFLRLPLNLFEVLER
jgi:hypothetical protein